MKIKFIKEYRAIPLSGGIDNGWGCYKDEVKDVHDDQGQWLIDNGFAEEVGEPGWGKPQKGEDYYFINDRGAILYDKYEDSFFDNFRVSVGNCFKNYFAADKYRDYLKAIATVRRDEGVLTTDMVRTTLAKDGTVYTIGINCQVLSVQRFYNTSAGAVYFDTGYHAKSSLDKHPDEWGTIAHYDWSRE